MNRKEALATVLTLACKSMLDSESTLIKNFQPLRNQAAYEKEAIRIVTEIYSEI